MLLKSKTLLFPPRRRACRQAGIAGAISKNFTNPDNSFLATTQQRSNAATQQRKD
jgi:hypothetical protein